MMKATRYQAWSAQILIAVGLFFLSAVVQAAVLTPQTHKLNLIESAQYLEDPSGLLTLEQVQAQAQSFKPWSQSGTDLNFGYTSSAYWVRVLLHKQDSASADWLLEVHYPRLKTLDFYPPNAKPVFTGSNRPFSSRAYFDTMFVMPITVSTQAEFYYLRVTSNHALTLPLTIWKPDAYRKQQQIFLSFQFAYYGGLLLVVLYGGLIFVALRDRRFLVFGLYVMSLGLAMFASNGFGRLLIWSDAVAFDEVSQTVFFSLTAFWMVLFSRLLLFTKDMRKKPKLERVMAVSQWTFLVLALLGLLQLFMPVGKSVVNQLLTFNVMVAGALITGCCWHTRALTRPGLRIFVVGWVVLWFGGSVASLRSLGWVPSNGFTMYAVQLTTVVETVLTALALAELLWFEHQAYGEAQKQALKAKHDLLELTRSSEEKLRLAVKERTAQLETSLKLEKNLREQYVRFGAMISHEFRTPLGIIQTQASLMRKEYERGLDQVGKRLEAIGSAAQRLAVMFDKWLQSDAVTQSLEVLEPKTLALHQWLKTLTQTNPHLMLNHRVDLELDPGVQNIWADEYHLGVALMNLIDNAAKYAPSETTITISTRTKPQHVGIAVSDQGPGIAVELQGKIFTEYFRVAPESQTRGVGLGLSIVQRIVQAHGGHVSLVSAPGRGSTFCIWLPDTMP